MDKVIKYMLSGIVSVGFAFLDAFIASILDSRMGIPVLAHLTYWNWFPISLVVSSMVYSGVAAFTVTHE